MVRHAEWYSQLIAYIESRAGHSESIISTKNRSGPEILEWHIQKREEYGFTGWWIWAYQDTPAQKCGIRGLDGKWKEELLKAVK